jgi:predicted transcriptional regulator
MTIQLALDPAIVAHVAAINSFDIDAIMDTFAEDALVNDVSREFWGHQHIRAWITKEMVGDHVTLEPIEVADNSGLYAVRCKYDGDYDKTNLPNPLIMTNYFRVRDGKIVTLFVIKNNEPKY